MPKSHGFIVISRFGVSLELPPGTANIKGGKAMAGCCDPNAPKLLMLNVGGQIVGLVGVEQAFIDLMDLGLLDEQIAEKLLEIVRKKILYLQVLSWNISWRC